MAAEPRADTPVCPYHARGAVQLDCNPLQGARFPPRRPPTHLCVTLHPRRMTQAERCVPPDCAAQWDRGAAKPTQARAGAPPAVADLAGELLPIWLLACHLKHDSGVKSKQGRCHAVV